MKKFLIAGLILCCTLTIMNAQDFNEYFTKSDSLLNLKKYDEALKYGQMAFNIALKEAGKESKPYANAANLVGVIYYSNNQYDKAIEYFYIEKDAKKVAYGTNSKNYAKALNNLSSVLSQLGKNKEAEPIMREALQIKINNLGMKDTSVATTANNLGAVCFNLGLFNEAERYYLLAADIRKNIIGPNSMAYATTAFNLGALYRILGNYQFSQSNLETALKLYVQFLGEKDNATINAMSELAMCYIASGEEQKSKELLEKVRNLRLAVSGSNNPEYYRSGYNLAMYYWNEQKYPEAIKLLEETMSSVEKNMGNGHPLYTSCLNSLGIISWQTGDIDKAYQYLSTTVKLREMVFGKNHPEYATALHNLAAIIKETGNYPVAENKYREALDLYLHQVRNVFPYLSEVEKAKFYANIQERFSLFFLYCLSRYKENPQLLSDMYNYRIATKGVLLDATRKIRNQINASNNPALIMLFNDWKNAKETMSKYYSMSKKDQAGSGIEINALEAKANKLEKQLSAESKVFGENFRQEMSTWQDIQKSLKPGEAALEFIRLNYFDRNWTDSVYYAVLIVTPETKDNPSIVLFGHGFDLDKYYIRNYLNSIKFQIDDKDSYNAFWFPIETELPGIRKVYASLDGVYNKINLNAILRPYGDYVLDQMNVVVVQNTSDLLSSNIQTGQNKSAYLIGNPAYSLTPEQLKQFQTADEAFPIYSKVKFEVLSSFIPELPGSQVEVDNIKDLLKDDKWSVTSYENTTATEGNFKHIKKADIVHLATHGFFLQDVQNQAQATVFGVDVEKAAQDPMLRSGLLFTGATNSLAAEGIATKENENGILTAYEASSLDFDGVELLILSACETGLGEVKNGEGVYGLQRAFAIAGAQKIIMSLWKVSDKTTQELMGEFYRNRLAGDDIDESLRKAQMKIKREWPNPYFWGGFISIGKK